MKKSKSFTLVEILVAVFIMVLAVTMLATMSRFAVGGLRSAGSNAIVMSSRNIMDTLNQKMLNANERIDFNHKGFGIFGSGNNLLIVGTKSDPDNVYTCFLHNGDNLSIAQKTRSTCSGEPFTPLNLPTVKVTDFTLNQSSGTPPRLDITLTLQDKSDPTNTNTIKTSYALDLETWRNLNP